MKRTKWATPLALAVVVAVIVGGAVWLGARGGTDAATSSRATPPVLHLSSAANGRDVAMAASSADSAADVAGSGAAYVLDGELPAGSPDDQSVFRLPAADADDAAAVADALGLSMSPRRVDGGWTARSGDHQLVVRDDGGWSYSLDCAPDTPVSSADDVVGCAVASSGGVAVAPDAATDDAAESPCNPDTDDCVRDEPAKVTPAQALPGPTEAEARAAAAPILDRLGLADARVTVWTGDPTATVQASPVVDGLDTVGWVTSLQVDRDGAVMWADGWIPDTVRGDHYPVVTATRAFELLQEQPRPMMELCAQRPDGKPGCADVPPAKVTGASLGLLLDYDGRHVLLVPAWLFDVGGQPEPVAQVAIEPAFLAPPPAPNADDGATPTEVPPGEPVPVDGGVDDGSTGSGSTGSDPGR